MGWDGMRVELELFRMRESFCAKGITIPCIHFACGFELVSLLTNVCVCVCVCVFLVQLLCVLFCADSDCLVPNHGTIQHCRWCEFEGHKSRW